MEALFVVPVGKQALTNQGSPLRFEDWELTSKKLATLFRRWVARWGHQISYDDAYSEVCLRWVLARDGFRPELGFQFKTYFCRSVQHAVRPYVMSLRGDNSKVGDELRLDERVGTDDGDARLGDLIEDRDQRNPEEIVSAREASRDAAPLVRRMLDLMQEAPDELRQELEAAQAQREMAQRMGIACRETSFPSALTPKVLGKIFGFNWKQRTRLQQEIEEASDYV